MPGISTPNFAQEIAGSSSPGDSLTALARLLQRHVNDVGASLNHALVVGDSLQVLAPFSVTVPDDTLYPGATGGPAFSSGNFTPLVGDEPGFSKSLDGFTQFNGGLVAVGAAVPANNQILFTLPSVYWPARNLILPSVTRDGSSNDVFCSIGIDTAGTVRTRFAATWFANSFINLSGRFPAKDRTPAPWASPLKIAHQLPTLPAGVLVLSAIDSVTGVNAAPVSQPIWNQDADPRFLDISSIPGLVPTRTYSVTLATFVGV